MHLRLRIRQVRNRRRFRGRCELTVDPDTYVGKVQVSGWGARGAVKLGKGTRIDDDVLFVIAHGGVVECGPRVWIRRGAVLNVTGRLELQGDNVISWNSVIHCADSVTFEPMASAGEGVSVVDSSHFHGEVGADDENVYHNVGKPEPVVIGRNTWLGAKCTVVHGVRLGTACTVASQSLVRSGTYPDRAFLVGIPARMTGVAD